MPYTLVGTSRRVSVEKRPQRPDFHRAATRFREIPPGAGDRKRTAGYGRRRIDSVFRVVEPEDVNRLFARSPGPTFLTLPMRRSLLHERNASAYTADDGADWTCDAARPGTSCIGL